ncbi:hypothetical protein D7030_05385 [Flavobacteriaceae bacterium AU392]|nr:hypothetical protein D1817_11860 [Flavobacteriaceae bacterium]RKM86109.1 hypothetical protein D7030_05385 [Flavobacteriaceae bacterium AU392]
MFLKRFKEKSNLKFINKVLDSREVLINNKPIESIGVIFNFNEFHDKEAFKSFFKDIEVKENHIKTITFISDEKSAIVNSWDSCFSSKDFGWNGKINNVELEQFINTKYDALISYYNEDNLELNLVSAASKANFKIGISNNNLRLNDFIIDVKSKDIEIFKTEVIKYLKVLNKI